MDNQCFSQDHHSTQRILVVDQEYAGAVRLAKLLEGAGYEVLAVQGGAAALDAISQGAFQLVITELHMKEVDGFDVIHHLHEFCREVAIIAIAGRGSMDSAIRAIHLHVEDFFVKPVDFPELEKAIERVFIEQDKIMHRQNLIDTVAHDIKAPLTSILGFSQILVEKDGSLNENFQRYTEIIQSNSRKILHLIDNYLLNSRLQDGEMETLFTAVNINSVIQCEIDAFQCEMDSKNLSVRFMCKSKVESIQADEQLVSRAIANLLGNAIKYSPRGEVVDICIEDKEGFVEVKLSNKGEELCPDDTGLIFQPFHRGDHHRQLPGVGLGLHIVRAIAKAHGGDVRCQTCDGEVVFTFLLPRDAASG